MRKIALVGIIVLLLFPLVVKAQALTIENLTVANGKTYEVVYDSLQVGVQPYIDRTYTISAAPDSLLGATYIKTANDDKLMFNDNFILFDVNTDVTIYIAYDQRLTTKPLWMAEFITSETEFLVGGYVTARHGVWQKDFPAGTIVLGGNEGVADSSMYFIVVVETTIVEPTKLVANWDQVHPYPDDLIGWELWYSDNPSVGWVNFKTIDAMSYQNMKVNLFVRILKALRLVSQQVNHSYEFIFPYDEGIWYFKIRAFDEVPNYSDYSNIASIDLGVIPDTEPPLNPENLGIERVIK